MSLRAHAPVLDEAAAAGIAARLWGVADPVARDLGSHQDRNFLITAGSGPDAGSRYVLKVANPAVPSISLDAQNAAMRAVAPLPVRTPLPLARPDGTDRARVELGGAPHEVRLLTFVDGTALTPVGYFAPITARRFGHLAGTLNAALASFSHPGAALPNPWDVRLAGAVVADGEAVLRRAEPDRGQTALRLAAGAALVLDDLDPRLPRQVIHGDLTDFNVVADPGPDARPVPAGVIDFGDLMFTWRAADTAVSIAALLVKDPRRPLRIAADVLAGYLRAQPLDEAEVDALWAMVTARACAGLASTLVQLDREPDNGYLHENLQADRTVFDLVAGIPEELGRLAMRRAAGLPAPGRPPLPRALPILAGRGSQGLRVVDLDTTSPLLDEGTWLDPSAVAASVAGIAAENPATPTVVPYGQAHVFRARPYQLDEPATVQLGVALTLPAGTPVRAPWPGRTALGPGGTLRLVGDGGWDVLLRGVDPVLPPGTEVDAQTTIARSQEPSGRTPATGRLGGLYVQVVAAAVEPPTHATAALASLWQVLCPDPSVLLGGPPDQVANPDPAPEPGPDPGLLARRAQVLAAVQKHYWADPPQFERGWRHHLVDVTGRVYLDGVNNVAVLGHSHPGVARAVTRALHTLNTNSRFHFELPVRFAEALVSTMPPGLDQVFLVSTGSEAVDLALRLARVHTGARDTIALRTAYHGWTTASDEVSSALMDNPRALLTRPEWIHLAEPPNLYRGPFTGPDAGHRYAEDVRRILAGLESQGRGVAAFIAETLNGNAGGIELPGDYLTEVYAAVRAAGGVAIADEVQVGYGRLGSHFWGFEMTGVVPDIVCLAKATGNGVPVAAVVTRRQIAESFSAEGSFFASMGGTPVGAAAGLATLDALREEDLMGNAERMGRRLRTGLEGLAERHPVVGAVHGRGLYLGLELVADPQTREPATELTDAVCERLLELGVVMAATGDHLNVLKIKPPLCIDAAGVDFLLEALEVTLREGW